MSVMLEYKGYTGRITAVDEQTGIFHGEVVAICDVITFQGKTLAELVDAFHESVDDYLAFCEERREEPEKKSLQTSPESQRRA
jgi:predicted HicB family RNase H-like nuclease